MYVEPLVYLKFVFFQSDHCLINKCKANAFTIFKLGNYNSENELIISTTQEAFSAINNQVNNFYNDSFPLKTKTRNKACNPIKPWMSKGLLISRKNKETTI